MKEININESLDNSKLIEKHQREWVINSGVDKTLTSLNVLSLHGPISYEYLLYTLSKTARRNDGRLQNKYLKKYAHIEAGGWWISGLDPLNNWSSMNWGRFKPDHPRQEWATHTQKNIKYESPPKTPNRVTYLRVPLHIWQMVAKLHNVPMPEDITITEEGEALGFWPWVVENLEIPIILTEGEKKAGCLLTLGFVAIGLPGIWNGRVGKDSSAFLAQIHAQLMVSKRLMVVSDSKRFIKKLERALNDRSILKDADELTPESEEDRQLKIWSIHSDNSASQANITFIKEINIAIENLDVLLASPSLSSGVDICKYHFDAVFGCFHSVSQSATECAQQLWRYRPNVPIYVWVAPHPPFGYAETNTKRIKENMLQMNGMTALMIGIDPKTGRRGAEKDWALDVSCQIEAQRNWSINNLRADLRSLLVEMDNSIIMLGDSANDRTAAWMKAAGIALDQEHSTKVANAKDIDSTTYQKRLLQDYWTPEQILEFEKYRIINTYGMAATPELVAKDAGGRLIGKIIALEGILAKPGETIIDDQGIEFMTPPTLIVTKDKAERDRLKICTDWSNHSIVWFVRHQLGLREILIEMIAGVEFAGNEPIIQTMAEFSQRFAPHIKAVLNITIPPNKSPMWILSQYLNQLGLSTVMSRRPTEQGKRVRYYRLNTDNLAFAKQVIEYRRQQREQREQLY